MGLRALCEIADKAGGTALDQNERTIRRALKVNIGNNPTKSYPPT